MRILVTRPQEDGVEIAARLAERGHQALVAPLLAPHFHDGRELALGGIQAILVTSANAVRALVRRTTRRDIPVFAVGPQTAGEARDAGFRDVKDANGNLEDLTALIARTASPDRGAMLYVRGEPSRQGLSEQLSRRGFMVRTETLYEVIAAQRLTWDAAEALRQGQLDAAMFFSSRSARVFRDCLEKEGLDGHKLIALCISAATAQALQPLSFQEVRVAGRPNQAAMLALVE
jgi:uroporphyrinogen-III synthase